jgi:predicted ATPase
MLTAISGSQGSGKSTILKRLDEHGFRTINRKTSRSILKDWAVSLEEVNNDDDLGIKFQDEITKRKWNDERKAVESSKLYFTERTHADFFTYALINYGKNKDYSDWLNEYYRQCMSYNQYYASVYYLRAGHFTIAKDEVRCSNPHYSRLIDIAMLDITRQMFHSGVLNIIETPDLEQRMNIITVQSIKR